jgi:tetratricopeptide (TPR) repeat protein
MPKGDLYAILHIEPTASTSQIKAAFRKEAKKLHPDTRSSLEPGSDSKMRELLVAYRILGSAESRKQYDRSRRKETALSSFNYRRFLLERINEPESVAKLILYELLHKMESQAIIHYERLKTMGGVKFERYFDRPEAMDIELCIAEEYEKLENYQRAYAIYRKLIKMELQKPGFGYYFDVVLDDFVDLVCKKCTVIGSQEQQMDLIFEACSLGLVGKPGATLYARQAELFIIYGNRVSAIESIMNARALYPKCALASKVAKRLGV